MRSGGCTAPATAPSTPSRAESARTAEPVAPQPISHLLQPAGGRRSAGRRLHRGGPAVDRCRELGLPYDADVYLCGPGCLHGRSQRRPRGLRARVPRASTRRHSAPAPPSRPASRRRRCRRHLPAGTTGTGPEVQFARSGISAPWRPAYASLLEFAEACDVPTRWSCRTGVCHNCETALLVRQRPLRPGAAGTAGAGKHPASAARTLRGRRRRPLSATTGEHIPSPSTYSAPGGLRQDPGGGAESLAEARTCGKGSRKCV